MPGHKHNGKDDRGESVKCNHIRYKSNTIHHKKLKKSLEYDFIEYILYHYSLNFLQFHFQLITKIMKKVFLNTQQCKIVFFVSFSFEKNHSAVASAVEVVSSIFKALIIFR